VKTEKKVGEEGVGYRTELSWGQWGKRQFQGENGGGLQQEGIMVKKRTEGGGMIRGGGGVKGIHKALSIKKKKKGGERDQNFVISKTTGSINEGK